MKEKIVSGANAFRWGVAKSAAQTRNGRDGGYRQGHAESAHTSSLVLVANCQACVAIPQSEMDEYLRGIRLVMCLALLSVPVLFFPLLT